MRAMKLIETKNPDQRWPFGPETKCSESQMILYELYHLQIYLIN